MDFKEMTREHGVYITLDENIERLNKKGTDFKLIEGVESFDVDNRRMNENVRYLISFPGILWHPKYGSCSGRSGLSAGESYPIWSSSFDIYNYTLTIEELGSICRKYSSMSETFRYKDTYSIEFRSDCTCESQIMNDIRQIAQEKLDKKPKIKEHSYSINGEKYTYTTNIEENLSSYTETGYMHFFLYDENKNYLNDIPGFAVYG